MIENVSVVPGISDHDIVLFTVNASCRIKKNVKRKIFSRKMPSLLALKKDLQNYHFIWIQGALTQSTKNGAASKIISTT